MFVLTKKSEIKLNPIINSGITVLLVRAERRDSDGDDGGVVPRVRVVVRLHTRNILVRTHFLPDVEYE